MSSSAMPPPSIWLLPALLLLLIHRVIAVPWLQPDLEKSNNDNNDHNNNGADGRGRLPPLILEENGRCPLGWSLAGEQCVQVQFEPSGPGQAEAECARLGGQLLDVAGPDGQPNDALLDDLAAFLPEGWPDAGGGLQQQNPVWLVGSGTQLADGDQQNGERVRFRPAASSPRVGDQQQQQMGAVGMRWRKGQQSRLELLVLPPDSAPLPFLCALSPLWRHVLLYQQSLVPRGAPRMEEQPLASYSFDPRAANRSYLSIPCSASGTPLPTVRWFQNGGDEVDLNSSSSPFVMSSGALLVPLDRLPSQPVSFHCVASNPLGSVRSHSATVRPAFIEPFRDTRLDAYPLVGLGHNRGGGARLDCNAPRHFPRSFSFAWVRSGSYEKFVDISARVYISLDGSLYFAYNVREDRDWFACTLSLAATQSAQQGPFFRLQLPPDGHIDPRLRLTTGGGGRVLHPHAFPPRMDEFQPQAFSEQGDVPQKGATVFLECFAFGFPVPSYRWSRVDGLPLPVGRHQLFSHGRLLRIQRAQPADSGRYRCQAHNQMGSASGEVRLAVQAPPVLLRPLADQLTAANSSASLRCPLAASPSSALQLEWFRNGLPLVPLLLPAEDRHRFRLADGDTQLTILDLRPSDSGVFQCTVSGPVGSVSSSALLLVSAGLGPRFHATLLPRRVFVLAGAQLALPCVVQAIPPAKAQWTARRSDGNRPLAVAWQRAPGSTSAELAVLKLDSAQMTDSGDYQCRASNPLGSATAVVRLEVIARPHVKIRPPDGNGTADASGGSLHWTCEVELDCGTADDCPEAQFSWEFNDRSMRSVAGGGKGPRVLGALRPRAAEGAAKLEVRRRKRERQQSRLEVPGQFARGRAKRERQQSRLEVPGQFARDHFGRFSCNSLFGGATAELEPAAGGQKWIPLKLAVEEVVERGALRLGWRLLQQKEKENRVSGQQKEKKSEKFVLEMRTAANRRWTAMREMEINAGTEEVAGGRGTDGQRRAQKSGQIELDGLQPNQRHQFRLRPSAAEDAGMAVATSQWVQTPQAVPSQPVQNLRSRMLDDRHVLLEWDPVETAHRSAPDLVYNVSWSGGGGNDTDAGTELVAGPRLVIPVASRAEESAGAGDNGRPCALLEVGVRPVNAKGAGLLATSKVVRVSREGPKRFASGLQLSTVNGTHLALGWRWEGEDPCENVVGAKIVCSQQQQSGGKEADWDGREGPNEEDDEGRLVSQSVPADYTHWLVSSLRPDREYSCRVTAFDQYGRMGPPDTGEGRPRARTAQRAPDQRPELSFVLVTERDRGNGQYAVLLDWKPVPLAHPNRSMAATGGGRGTRERGSAVEEDQRHRGYKIFVFVSETAEQAIELTLREAELHDPERPSARIDGLRPMFFYGIEVAAFNPGGLGPRSQRIPVRIGAKQQQRQQMDPLASGQQRSGSPWPVLIPLAPALLSLLWPPTLLFIVRISPLHWC